MSEVLEVPNLWRAGIITNKGLGLLSKLITGNTLSITRAEVGAGWVDPDLLPQQTAVSDPKQAPTFSTVSYPEEGKCVVSCKVSNAEVAESYIARQIGLYANDPDEGEILYYITQVEDPEGGTGIPASNLIPSYSSTWNLVVVYGMADGVDITVDPAGSVTYEELEECVDVALEESISEIFLPYTDAEIDALLGTYDGEDSSGGGSGGAGTLDHSLLYNRDAEDQHPISAIIGLEEELEEAKDLGGEIMEEADVDALWNEVMLEGKQT